MKTFGLAIKILRGLATFLLLKSKPSCLKNKWHWKWSRITWETLLSLMIGSPSLGINPNWTTLRVGRRNNSKMRPCPGDRRKFDCLGQWERDVHDVQTFSQRANRAITQ
jgi:hypothetical protein